MRRHPPLHLHLLRLQLHHHCLAARQLGIVTDPMVQPEGEQRPMLEQPSIGSFKLSLSQKALVMHKACLVPLHRAVLYNTILLPLLRVDERS